MGTRQWEKETASLQKMERKSFDVFYQTWATIFLHWDFHIIINAGDY